MRKTIVRCPFCAQIFGVPIAIVRSRLTAHALKCAKAPAGMTNDWAFAEIAKAIEETKTEAPATRD